MSTNQKNLPDKSCQLIFPLFDDSIKKCKCGCGLPVKFENHKWRTYYGNHRWDDPEYQLIHKQQMQRMWSNPEFKTKMELLNIERWSDPTFRQMHIDKAKIQWEDSEFVSKIQQGLKEKWTDPDYRKQMSAISSNNIKTLWENPEYRDKKSKLSKQQWKNPEYRNMMVKMFSDTNKTAWQNPEYRAKQIATMKLTNQRPELKEIRRINTTKANYIRWQNPEYKERVSKAIKKTYANPIYRQQLSERLKQRWTDNESKVKLFQGSNKLPNRIESLIDNLTPLAIRFVGNHKWWRTLELETSEGIVIRHKNPDFIIEGQRKILEINGKYWHRNDYPDEVWHNAWNKIGYKLLIIWDYEIKSNLQNVLERINQFSLEN